MHTELLLLSECAAGSYGEDCATECGQCVNSTVCDRVTGECDGPCEVGYMLSTCSKGLYPT